MPSAQIAGSTSVAPVVPVFADSADRCLSNEKIADTPEGKQRDALLNQIKRSSMATWQHIHMDGECDFSDERVNTITQFHLSKILGLAAVLVLPQKERLRSMTKRKITDPETTVGTLMDYALQALALLGGSSRKHQIIEQVEPLVKDILLPADYVHLHNGESGQEYAPIGCTDRTWPVWAGKTAIALWQLKVRGLIVSNKGVFSFTDKGRAYLKERRD